MPRPLEFNEAVADAICERLADGESLRSICRDDEMPAKSTVFKWLGLIPAFADQYARARETQADSLADDIVDIADNKALEPNRRPEMAGGQAEAQSLRRQGRCGRGRQD